MFLFTSIFRKEAVPGVSGILERAAQATGTDFAYLLDTARRESALNPEAKARTSSAAGLFQFIESTWLRAIHDWGARHGLSDKAAAISRDASGKLRVADRAAREEILNLRFDPEVSALMAGEFTRANGRTLEAGIGRRASAGELYIAHFLGAGGAVDLINSAAGDPHGIAAERFAAAARANRAIFYDRAGAPRGNAEVYKVLVAKHQERQQVPEPPAGGPLVLNAFAAERRGGTMFESLFTDTQAKFAYAPPTVSRGAGPIGQAVQNIWLNFFGKPDAGAVQAVERTAGGHASDPARLVGNGG